MKTVLITGASSGIGRALAFEFAERGWNTFLVARRKEALAEISEQLIQKGTSSYYTQCDVSNADDIENAVASALNAFGKIDTAILNAGVSLRFNFIEPDFDALRKSYETNTFGMVKFLTSLIEVMKKEGGTIAGVTSLADARPFAWNSAYCSSKIASTFLLNSAREELRNTNLNIVTIKPGFVRTEMTANHKYYMPFLMDAAQAAKIIADGLEQGKKRIYFPPATTFLTYLLKAMPDKIFDSISYLINHYAGNKL